MDVRLITIDDDCAPSKTRDASIHFHYTFWRFSQHRESKLLARQRETQRKFSKTPNENYAKFSTCFFLSLSLSLSRSFGTINELFGTPLIVNNSVWVTLKVPPRSNSSNQSTFSLYHSEASLNPFEPTEKSLNWRMVKVESWPRSPPVRLRQNLSRSTSDFIVLR